MGLLSVFLFWELFLEGAYHSLIQKSTARRGKMWYAIFMRIRINITVNRAIQILLAYLFVVVTAESLYAPIFAIFIVESGAISGTSLRTVGFALALYAISKSIIQVPLAHQLDLRRGERDDFWALIAGGIMGVVYPFLLLLVRSSWHLYLIEVFAGAGAAFLMAAYYSLFARHIDKGEDGFEWSLFSVGGLTVSSALGAAVGGVLAELYGFSFLFITSGIINFFVLLLLAGLYPLLDGARPVSLPPFSPIPKNPTTKQ